MFEKEADEYATENIEGVYEITEEAEQFLRKSE